MVYRTELGGEDAGFRGHNILMTIKIRKKMAVKIRKGITITLEQIKQAK